MNAAVTPDMRAQTKQLLAGMSGFAFLACAKASLKDPYGAVLYCYYRTKIPRGNLDLGFGLTPGGQLAYAMGQAE